MGRLDRIGADYAAIIAGQGLALVFGLVGVSLATRVLGPSGYGTVALFVSALQLAYVLGVHWTMSAAIRFGREALVKGGHGGRFLWSWLGLVGLALGVAIVATTIALPWFRRYVGLPAGGGTLIVGFLVAVTFAKGVEQLLQASGRMRTYALLSPTAKLIYCLALAGLPWAGTSVTAPLVVMLMGATWALQGGLGLPLLERRLFRPVTWDGALARQMVLYSTPLLAKSALAYLLDWMDIFTLRAFRSATEIGVYHVAYQSMWVFSELLAGVSTLAFPLLADWRATGSEKPVLRYLERFVPQASVLWSVLVPFAALSATFLFPAIFGEAFRPAGAYFSLLLCGTVFQVITYSYSPILASHDLTGRSTGIFGAMAVINLVLDLALVPAWGASGAALATAAAYAIGALLHLRVVHRHLGIRRAMVLVPPAVAVVPLLVIAGGLPVPTCLAVLFVSTGLTLAWARWRGILRRSPVGAGV